MNFFIDNNIGPPLARALNELSKVEGHKVVHLRELFPDNCTDPEWIGRISDQDNWVAVTIDNKIRKDPHEYKIWRESDLTIFFLQRSWRHLKTWDISWKLVKWWPAIINQAINVKSVAGYLIPVKGSKMEILS